MATIKRFEDLEVWQIARELCRFVLKVTSKEKFSKDFALKDQIRASSGSAMDNSPEGYEIADKLCNKLGSFITYLNSSDIRGIKFKDRK